MSRWPNTNLVASMLLHTEGGVYFILCLCWEYVSSTCSWWCLSTTARHKIYVVWLSDSPLGPFFGCYLPHCQPPYPTNFCNFYCTCSSAAAAAPVVGIWHYNGGIHQLRQMMFLSTHSFDKPRVGTNNVWRLVAPTTTVNVLRSGGDCGRSLGATDQGERKRNANFIWFDLEDGKAFLLNFI